jgi:hypothetical protein
VRLRDVVRRAAVAAVLLSSSAVFAQDANGPEFAVNTFTTGSQANPAVAQDGSGHFIVTWAGSGNGEADGVFARRFSSSGIPLGPEFAVNSDTTGIQDAPGIVVNHAGEFVVTWTSIGSDSRHHFFGRRFDATGVPMGSDFPINTDTVSPRYSRMAGDGAGNFIVVWEVFDSFAARSGIFARRYDVTTGFGPEFMVSSYTTNFQNDPDAAIAADGSFVVAWTQPLSIPGYPQEVFARRFDATGAPLTGDVLVSESTTGNRHWPSLASEQDGAFVVVWDDQLGDGDGYGILARRFDAAGSPMGGTFLVNTYTTYDQRHPRVAMDSAGKFMVTWTDYGGSDGSGTTVSEREFDTAGNPVSSEFVVNSYTTGVQSGVAVTSGRRGQFVVTWMSYRQDGNNFGVFGRRFGDLIFGDSFESGGLAAWSTASTDGGDLSVTPDAALGSPGLGLQAVVNDTTGIYVEDDTPADEDRYRARFYFDTHGFDPGVAQGHVRTRIFIGFEENPTRRLFAVVLRLLNGQYGLMGRVRRDDNSQAETGFFPITDGPHSVEIDWRRSSGQDAPDGTFEMWIDGTSVATLSALDNSISAVDFARMGAMSVKQGANGTLFFDAFESHQYSAIGPLP